LQWVRGLHRGCPFGVIDINPVSHTAQKCTLCYDRLQGGMEPACSKPADKVDSVWDHPRAFRERAHTRVEQLPDGEKQGVFSTAPTRWMLGGLNSFYLLVDQPEVYGLPPDRRCRTRN